MFLIILSKLSKKNIFLTLNYFFSVKLFSFFQREERGILLSLGLLLFSFVKFLSTVAKTSVIHQQDGITKLCPMGQSREESPREEREL